jgi:inhibitor of KinA sporulation pathway (predicted exonuclease)
MDLFKEKIIILWDTEFTCWKGCKENGWDKERNQFREFIQIALIKVDINTMNIINEFQTFVKPIKNPQLSDYCTNLTHIEQDIIDEADTFDKVQPAMLNFIGNTKCYSFGQDFKVLYENQEINNLNNPFKDQFFDLRIMLIEEGYDVKSYCSGTLSELFGIKSEFHTHDAVGDAKTVLIALKELKKKL